MQSIYDILLKLLENTPLIWIIVGGVLVVASAITIVIYLIAFFQGREISFWPPKIGASPKKHVEKDPHLKQAKLPNMPKSSFYDPIDDNNRLNIQGGNNSSFDEAIFNEALDLMNKKDDLIALDIGCADGSITVSRFKKFECFSKIYAIDNNQASISHAKQKYENEKFIFNCLDIEKETDILEKLNINKKFNFVFLSYTLHHLADPSLAINKIKKILTPNGVLIVRTIDDGCKLFYSNNHSASLNSAFNKLIDLSKYEGDREHGRKLYYQLKSRGFNTIKMHYQTRDTIDTTELDRSRIFKESLAWRAEPIKSIISKNIDSELKKEYEWAIDAIESLEGIFVHDDSLYYMETQHIAIAFIK